MGRSIVRQPDGLYAVFSSIIDDFVLVNCTPQEIIDYYVKDAKEEIERSVCQSVEKADNGTSTYTFEETLDVIKMVHGKRGKEKSLEFISETKFESE